MPRRPQISWPKALHASGPGSNSGSCSGDNGRRGQDSPYHLNSCNSLSGSAMAPLSIFKLPSDPRQQTTAKNAESTPPVVAMVEPPGALRLHDLEAILSGTQSHQSFLPFGQPFDVHLTLDLSDVVVPEDKQFSYKLSIYGKSLERHPRQTIGEPGGLSSLLTGILSKLRGIVAGTKTKKSILSCPQEQRGYSLSSRNRSGLPAQTCEKRYPIPCWISKNAPPANMGNLGFRHESLAT
jgi:hypothetical protein